MLRFQIRTRDDGRSEVVDVFTGQVRGIGSSPGFVRFVQASLVKEQERKDKAAAERT